MAKRMMLGRAAETSTNTPTNSGGTMTATLSGSAPTVTWTPGVTGPLRTFSAAGAVDTGTVRVHVYQANANGAPATWCEAVATYHASGNTLTWTAADISGGSAGQLTFPAFTGVVHCSAEFGLEDALRAMYGTRAYIEGGLVDITGAHTATVSDLGIVLNGKEFEITGTSYTTNTTSGPKNLSGGSINIETSGSSPGICYVYAYKNAGSPDIRFQPYTGTGDGGVPVWSADHGYWYAPTTGLDARRIAAFTYTSTSAQRQIASRAGGERLRRFAWDRWDGGIANAIGSTPSYVPVASYYPFLPLDAEEWIISVRPFTTSSTLVQSIVTLSLNGGTTDWRVIQGPANTVVGSILAGEFYVPARGGTLHYKNLAGSGPKHYIDSDGITMFV